MKKIFLVLTTLIGFGLNVFGQNTVVIQNNNKSNKIDNDCPYRINGICSTEDIGGVAVETTGGGWKFDIVNYNNFAVTIIYEVTSSRGIQGGSYFGTETETGTIVLKANESKPFPRQGSFNVSTKMIVRKLNNISESNNNNSGNPSNSNDDVVKLLGYLYVYPEDIGEMTYSEAMSICGNINAAKSYGYYDWRLPTLEELKMIMNNKSKLQGTWNRYSRDSCLSYLSGDSAGSGEFYCVPTFTGYGEKVKACKVGYIRLVRTNK